MHIASIGKTEQMRLFSDLNQTSDAEILASLGSLLGMQRLDQALPDQARKVTVTTVPQVASWQDPNVAV